MTQFVPTVLLRLKISSLLVNEGLINKPFNERLIHLPNLGW